MTIVIGLAPGERGISALHLGAMLARSSGDHLVVAAIVPTPWPPAPDPGDAEYLAYAEKSTQESLDRARAELGNDILAEYVLQHAPSASSGLLEVARERAATLVALGSASSGVLGRVSLGGVAERLLHSSHVPVTLAPEGFIAGPTGRVERITVAFGRADHDSNLLAVAASTAKTIGASLRVACFAVRPLTAYAGSIEVSAEDLVVGAWVKDLERAIDRIIGASGIASVRVDTVVGQGGSWAEALADVRWAEGDVLAVGSSSSPFSRFFLGSHASKIVRNAPVPVYLLPRSLPMP